MSDYELIHAAIGRLEKCTKNNMEMYPPEDWRMSYCGQKGLIAIYGNSDDMVIACFCPEGQRRHLQTTAGHLETFEPNYIVITRNSKYLFKEIGIDESERESLCRTYEAMNVPKDVIEEVIAEAIEIGNPHTKKARTHPMSRDEEER